MANHPQFRPPAEADSLILQIDEGCPHNACTFCGMYKGIRHRRRPMGEVMHLIEAEAATKGVDARRIFLADGDVMARPFTELEAILQALASNFPRLARVNSYANGSSILAKSEAELAVLRGLKLQTLYMGLESGDEQILAACHKGETAADMAAAGIKAQAAGLRMSVMVLLGLGGTEGSERHAEWTAQVLNRMQPRLLSALRVVPVRGTPLHKAYKHGDFDMISEAGAVREVRDIVAALELESTIFRANHASNVIPLEARLPRDKPRLLAELDTLLASGRLDAHSPGPLPLWL